VRSLVGSGDQPVAVERALPRGEECRVVQRLVDRAIALLAEPLTTQLTVGEVAQSLEACPTAPLFAAHATTSIHDARDDDLAHRVLDLRDEGARALPLLPDLRF
jgi:hypothetical protein